MLVLTHGGWCNTFLGYCTNLAHRSPLVTESRQRSAGTKLHFCVHNCHERGLSNLFFRNAMKRCARSDQSAPWHDGPPGAIPRHSQPAMAHKSRQVTIESSAQVAQPTPHCIAGRSILPLYPPSLSSSCSTNPNSFPSLLSWSPP